MIEKEKESHEELKKAHIKLTTENTDLKKTAETERKKLTEQVKKLEHENDQLKKKNKD